MSRLRPPWLALDSLTELPPPSPLFSDIICVPHLPPADHPVYRYGAGTAYSYLPYIIALRPCPIPAVLHRLVPTYEHHIHRAVRDVRAPTHQDCDEVAQITAILVAALTSTELAALDRASEQSERGQRLHQINSVAQTPL